MKVIFTGKSAGTDAGTPVIVSQLSAAVAEVIRAEPPPMFSITTCCETGVVTEAVVLRATKVELNVRNGGGTVIDRFTPIVWDMPAQGLGARQVTTIDVVRGAVVAPRFKALGSSAMPILPGVVLPAVTSSQETAGVGTTEYVSGVCGTLDCTVTLTGFGRPADPTARLNENDAAERSRSGVPAGVTTICVDDVSESAGVLESVSVSEKLLVPLAVGVPLISPLARVRPGGSDPLPMVYV